MFLYTKHDKGKCLVLGQFRREDGTNVENVGIG